MEHEIVTFLQNSGLESYIEIFTKNKIGINQIGEITADILPLLIAPIGDQLRYKKAVEALKAKVSTENNVPTTSNTAECIIKVIDTHENILTDYELQHSRAFCDESNVLAELELKNVSPLTLADENLENFDNQDNENDELSTKINTHKKLEEIAEIAQSQPCKKVKLEDIRYRSSSPSTSSISETSTTSGIVNNKLKSKVELESFLTTCNDGRIVLSTFEKNGKLNEAVRRKLTTIIVDHLMVVYGNDLKNSHFKSVAELIVEVFPTECSDAYYIEPHTEGVKQKVSKGKLPYKYRNLKTFMKERGVMISKSSSNQVSSNDITIKNLLSEQQLLESQVWLKSYTEPWTEVLERWTKTAPNRIAQFTKRKDLSITNILTEWPLFKHPLGYSLISIDFTVLFPEKGLKILNGWPSCRDKLIDIIRAFTNKDKHSIAYQVLNTLPSVISEDGKDIVAMYLLPILLPPAIIREKDKGSRVETNNSRSSRNDSVSKQIFLEQRKKKYQKLMRPIQPCVIIVRETLQTAKDFYVLFENVEYKLSSVLGAVDTCFKVIHVMNLVYPPEAYNTWMFIQRYFYKLYLQKEKVPTCVTSLISEL